MNSAPTNPAPNQPAIVPDQVFLGLTCGQNFGPPIDVLRNNLKYQSLLQQLLAIPPKLIQSHYVKII